MIQPDFHIQESIPIWLGENGIYQVGWASGPDTLMGSIDDSARGLRTRDFMRFQHTDVLYGPTMMKLFEEIG